MVYNLCRSTGTWLRISGTKTIFIPKITSTGHPAEHCRLRFTPTSRNSFSRWKTPRHQLDLASSWPPQDGRPTEQQRLRKGPGPAKCSSRPRGLQLLAPKGQALAEVPAPPRRCRDRPGCAGRTSCLRACGSRQSWEEALPHLGQTRRSVRAVWPWTGSRAAQ